MPADVPPQSLRYWPAMHNEAEQAEQAEAPACVENQKHSTSWTYLADIINLQIIFFLKLHVS